MKHLNNTECNKPISWLVFAIFLSILCSLLSTKTTDISFLQMNETQTSANYFRSIFIFSWKLAGYMFVHSKNHVHNFSEENPMNCDQKMETIQNIQ